MNDATLERYLETAKLVADHAMIGAGPLYFHKDPGLTGLELSAVDRIQSIYRAFGFRASAGEGAKPYGLERFATAFHVTWQYRFRKQLGLKSSMDDLARTAGISGKFARHIWNVMHRREPTFPISRIVESWHGFPSPDRIDGNHEIVIGEKSQALFEELQEWQKRLADAAGQEEAALLSGRKVEILNSNKFRAQAMRKRRKLSPGEAPDLNDPNTYERDGRVRIEIRVEHASDDIGTKPAVVFSNSQFRFDLFDGTDLEPVPLKTLLDESEIQKLNFGFNSDGEPISADEFAIHVGQRETFKILLPDDVRYGELKLVATLDSKSGRDAVVRCTIADVTAEFDPQLGIGSKEYSALLRDSNSSKMDKWETGLAEFAKALPQISHREPTPSDRDPISPLYEQKYNLPERNYFHTAVKYYRDDGFLTKHVLPSNQLATLDQAWTDLLTSFNYHNVNLRFAAKKHDIDLHDSDIQTESHVWINQFPTEVQPVLAEQKRQYDAMQQSLKAAEPQHLSDAATFASKAWRRPLRKHEITEFDAFYHQQRMDRELTHREAIRALLVRILVSPDFLYRLEQTPNSHRAVTPTPTETESQAPKLLSTHELASRLSFSIWSSIPDDELLETAHNGTLKDAKVLKSQLVRLLKSPKSRRLATEFFGQWFGFYNFDDFRGVDAKRFPEFDDRLKRSLHDEAISFFEYLIREDRPYTEIVQANYTFLDTRSANHYGITLENTDRDTKLANAEYAMDHRDRASSDQVRKVDVSKHQRGGLLGLGAILTSTSAPLRTSPVKRGDWILRRLIGTPVPPPPADAGSIPAEEVLSDGLTVRQRLESHRSRPECMNCHVRIDPLGFALENFDSLGRWRDTYSDDQNIDPSGTLPSGESIRGFEGLRKHLAQEDVAFRRTFATNLAAYFLGRAETLSDAALIDQIAEDLKSDPRISTAITTLVQSDQFQKRRVP